MLALGSRLAASGRGHLRVCSTLMPPHGSSLVASGCSHPRACSTLALPPHKLLPMPALSPSMRRAVLHRWLLEPGAPVKSTDLVCEVRTTELLEDSDDEFTLEVESHEDGFLAKLLLQPGEAAGPDVPIAVICEEEASHAIFYSCHTPRLPILHSNLPPPPNLTSQEDIKSFEHFETAELVPAGHFCWQAYVVKSGER